MRKIIAIILLTLICFFSCCTGVQQKQYINQVPTYTASPLPLVAAMQQLKLNNNIITIKQWIKMLCQAYNIYPAYLNGYLEQAYKLNWVDETVFNQPNTQATYNFVLNSGLIAAKIPIYNNALETGYSLGFIDDTITTNTLVTEKCANEIIDKLLSNKNNNNESFYIIKINNPDNIYLNDYLAQLKLIPDNIINHFNENNWQCSIDLNYMYQLSEQYHGTVSGLTSYYNKTIYISTSSSLIHEFGHYTEYMLGFPKKIQELFLLEAELAPLRKVALTNKTEYFAECFVYWINYRNNKMWMDIFQYWAPQTYKYMNMLFEENFE